MKKTIIILCLKNIALFGARPDQTQANNSTIPITKCTHKTPQKETDFDPVDEGLEKLFHQTNTPNWREQFAPSQSTSFFCYFLCFGK